MDDIRRALQVVNSMVEAGVIRRYAIIGAYAATYYTDPTSTEDLDILISVEDLENRSSGILTLDPVRSYLKSLGYDRFEKEGIVVEGWPVQFLPVASSLDEEGLREAVEVEIADEGREVIRVKVLRAEHIVATALKVGRPKDRERVLRFVEAEVLDWDWLKDILNRHSLLQVWRDFSDKMGLADFNERS
jgi:hypothetical protein